MTSKNKDVKGARISEGKFQELVHLFLVDLNAPWIASLTDLNRNAVNRHLRAIRMRLPNSAIPDPLLKGRLK